MIRLTISSIAIPVLALIGFSLCSGIGEAGQVKLEAGVAHPSMVADKQQTTFLKVGLTGFESTSREERTPVNIALVLDKSGSMRGEKMRRAKEAAIMALQRLGPEDIVSVVAYDSAVRVLVPATKLTDKESVFSAIRSLQAGGSTALFGGVSKGAHELRKFLDRNRVNRVILLSDGKANVGPQSPSELARLGASLIKENISVSTMGLGRDYNEDLMSELAKKSDGNHIFIESSSELARIFNLEFGDVLSVVAQEVVIKIKCAEDIRPVRVLGREAEINGQDVFIKLNQIYAKQEKYVLLEVEVPATEADQTRKVAVVELSHANMETKITDKLTSTVSVTFTGSEEAVEKKTSSDVMVAAVTQIANQKNKLALALRDQGRIDEARAILTDNSEYLGWNASKYRSDILLKNAARNLGNAENLEDEDWARERKKMKRYQHKDEMQQGY